MQQTLPQTLPLQQLDAWHQQAVQAWAASAQQTLPGYAYLQSMMQSLQGGQTSGATAEGNLASASLPGKIVTPPRILLLYSSSRYSATSHFASFKILGKLPYLCLGLFCLAVMEPAFKVQL